MYGLYKDHRLYARGLYRDNGKENGNYYWVVSLSTTISGLGSGIWGMGFRAQLFWAFCRFCNQNSGARFQSGMATQAS